MRIYALSALNLIPFQTTYYVLYINFVTCDDIKVFGFLALVKGPCASRSHARRKEFEFLH